MLEFFHRNSRRSFLQVGTLGLGGFALPELLRAEESASSVLKDRSVVFLFMHGGPPQAETFDPKMTAPREYRSFNGEIETSVPGVTYGASMQRLAKLAHLTTAVRSFQPGDGNHNIKPIVSGHSLDANLGSIYSRVSGITDPSSGMPINTALFPRAVYDEAQPAVKQFGDFTSTGDVGAAYKAFVPSSKSVLMDNMRLRISQSRMDDRKSLLKQLDRFRRAEDLSGSMDGIDRFNQQAYDVIFGSVTEAFDLAKESQETRQRYDTSGLVPYSKIDKKWNNHKNYRDHVQSLGKLMLLARRLCESGSRFVTVTTNFVWDFHADVNNATLEEGMQYVGLPFDHAVSAFIEDVEARGLSDKILLVCCGEMGRTPKINAKGGRDHWGRLGPLLMYGGDLNLGSVLGQSDANAGEPNSQPVRIPNLLSTIYHQLFDVAELRLRSDLPGPLMRMIESGTPIEEIT